jgi:uncharacterized membrane protein YhaH (DUF805 family)
MESQNPYQPPSTDVSAQRTGGIDQTSPFSPSGRFGRLSYIAWIVIVGFIGNFITAIFGGSGPVPPDIGVAVLVAIVVISLVSLVFYIIFSIRRCHDFNGSGWLLLLGLIPLVNVVFFLYLWLKRGEEGANNYAPPRVTAGWERAVGIFGIFLIVVMFIGVIAAIAIPAYMEYMGQR